MTHERIWAPWRLPYVQNAAEESAASETDPAELELLPGADPGCFLCQAVADSADRQRLVVHRGEHSITLLNLYPYTNGHLLVAPRHHLGRLDELAPEVQLELTQTIARMVNLLEKLIRAQGFNVGLNLGRVAGAGLPGHFHWHVVPRWNGDTNFMSSLAGVRVIPQSLDALWELLSGELAD